MCCLNPIKPTPVGFQFLSLKTETTEARTVTVVVLVVVLVVVVVVDVRVVSEQFCPLGWCGLKKTLVYRTIL